MLGGRFRQYCSLLLCNLLFDSLGAQIHSRRRSLSAKVREGLGRVQEASSIPIYPWSCIVISYHATVLMLMIYGMSSWEYEYPIPHRCTFFGFWILPTLFQLVIKVSALLLIDIRFRVRYVSMVDRTSSLLDRYHCLFALSSLSLLNGRRTNGLRRRREKMQNATMIDTTTPQNALPYML